MCTGICDTPGSQTPRCGPARARAVVHRLSTLPRRDWTPLQAIALLLALARFPILVSLDLRENLLTSAALAVLLNVVHQQSRRALLARDRLHRLGPSLQRVRVDGNASFAPADLDALAKVSGG